MKPKHELTQAVKDKAKALGFDSTGIAKPELLDEKHEELMQWLSDDMHGAMDYMSRHAHLRKDPRRLITKAGSVIVVMQNYLPRKRIPEEDNYIISAYAYGRDYHKVIRKKLKKLLAFITAEVGEANAKIFVDSAPVMEKVWAEKSGLGWIGKNTCLINRNSGSFFFLGGIIIDIELEFDMNLQKDLCGSCTRCLKACPTGALYEPYRIDARKCISYLTIENKGPIPEEFSGKMKDRIFGCDICQDVCPWNRLSRPANEKDFEAAEMLFQMRKDDWENLTREQFDELFRGSAVRRAKYEGLMRNIKFQSENSKSKK